jgi:hypothetical protein
VFGSVFSAARSRMASRVANLYVAEYRPESSREQSLGEL